MNISEFVGCCGARILYAFGADEYVGREASEAEITAKKNQITAYLNRFGSNRGLIFATLNQNQIKNGWGDALIGAGFKKAGQLASNGGNDIQGYVLNVTPSNAILAKKRKAVGNKGRFAR